MRTGLAIAASVMLFASASAASAEEIKLSISDGRVTLVANNVPLGEILAEWARVGQTTIVGAERLSGPPVTLQLDNIPEGRALETLLRTASGYMAAPRAEVVANASVYDRILILPTSNAPDAGPAPVFRPAPILVPQPMPAEGEDAAAADEMSDLPDDITEAQKLGLDPTEYEVVPNEGGQPAGATFDYANPQLMLQQRQRMLQQQQQEQGGAAPTSAVPGMIVQPPSQPPNVFPGTTVPQPSATPPANPTSARPGEVVQPPPPQQFNPYGLPAGVQPGSVQGPAGQPDRAKYMNPYQPNPPKPPEGD